MKPRRSTARNALAALALAALFLAACGGRAQTLREIDDDTLSGGSSGSGPTSAGRGGSAGSRAGSSSSSGSSSGDECNNLNCGVPDCPAGMAPQLLPGACCETCSPCACPPIGCPPGSHPEKLDGNCCPSCVDDKGAACQVGRQAYASLREVLLDKYRYGCTSASECVLIAPLNSCEQGCSYAAIWSGAAASFDSNLANAADMYCVSCTQGPIPPCDPPSRPHQCVAGQCSFDLK